MDVESAGGRRVTLTRDWVLAVIRARGAVTRTDLGAETGLSRSAVADAVRDLIDARLVREETSPPDIRAGRGRPSMVLSPSLPEGLVVGIDFGHTSVAVAVADTTGTIVARARCDVDVDGEAEHALDLAADMFTDVLAEAGGSSGTPLAVAAAVAGPLDAETGRVRPPTLLSDWVDLDPALELSGRLGVPVRVGNDADLGALGEMRFGSARGYRDFLYVKASIGVGAGLVLGGRIYRGSSGMVGEIGHTRIRHAGSWCRCGGQGCLETVVSLTTIRSRLAELGLEAGSAASLGALCENPIAARIVREAGRTLGRVLADLCNCLNPAAVVLGGEIAAAGAPFADGVREAVVRHAQPTIAQGVRVHLAGLGADAALRGAIASAVDQVLSTDRDVIR